MAFANDPTDPANMTPEERLAEVAAIFAEGVLRVHRRGTLPGPKLAVIHPVEAEGPLGNGPELRFLR